MDENSSSAVKEGRLKAGEVGRPTACRFRNEAANGLFDDEARRGEFDYCKSGLIFK